MIMFSFESILDIGLDIISQASTLGLYLLVHQITNNQKINYFIVIDILKTLYYKSK